ncbi:hypothetical protein PoB_003389000 [Plakobranchus ocellatus]|uniref:Kunitz/Bovine pancreatic trypsin inhibitor domain protein n=1 Tax=Plakobranchus ocellatus TaxID=259542 RepID=A0AAV4AJ76_9GAST|nr:hypothetical protein PoB_003389000 [Plakobranchus ocellatus]
MSVSLNNGSLRVVPAKPFVDNGLNQCLLDCPWGTRCSLEFGTPQCVSISATAVGVGAHDTAGSLPVGQTVLDVGLTKCLLDCPIGTRCSLEFGTPQCVSVVAGAVGHGGHLDIASTAGLDHLDQFGNPIAAGSSLLGKASLVGLGRCSPMVPACRATRFDRFEQCRFTFDLRQQRCVKVYVRNICSRLSGPRSNLFFSMVECERSCLGRLSY